VCSEPECELTNASTALAAGKLYKQIIAALDPTRPVTGAMVDFSWQGRCGGAFSLLPFFVPPPHVLSTPTA
jgi:hypothetical protein